MRKDFYTSDKFIESLPSYYVEFAPWKATQVYKIITKNHLEIKRVCDHGCGTGEVLHQLQKLLPGETILDGYDISPGAIKLSQPLENDGLKYYCEDLLQKEIEKYDLMLCLDVFEHVGDYLGFLERVKDKATYKIFHIPLDMCALMVVFANELIKTRTRVGHLHYFMKETALATLEDTGYEIIDWFYTDSALDLGRDWRTFLVNVFRQTFSLVSKDLAAHLFGGYPIIVLAK